MEKFSIQKIQKKERTKTTNFLTNQKYTITRGVKYTKISQNSLDKKIPPLPLKLIHTSIKIMQVFNHHLHFLIKKDHSKFHQKGQSKNLRYFHRKNK